MRKLVWRSSEALLLFLSTLIAGVALFMLKVAEQFKGEQVLEIEFLSIMVPVLCVMAPFWLLSCLLSFNKISLEQTVLPITSLLFVIGISMVWRLRDSEGGVQQIMRGLLPGGIIASVFILRPEIIERIRRRSVWIGTGGLLILFITGLFGVVDETGSRLSLKIGPLPSIQTSEMIKLALIIFLAWYIEHEGKAAEGRAISFLWFQFPALRYIAPAAAFIGAATLALVAMRDFGAVIILGILFFSMLYIGFNSKIFLSITALGISLAVIVGIILSQTWELPAMIRYRFLAFLNPWSSQVLPGGMTISEGPGYQIQHAIYAIISGGVTGTGLGLGLPNFIPLAHSDFILAAIMEEMGSAVGIAILALYALLILRIFRLAVMVPSSQVFERMLLTGIGVHFFTQVIVMAGGTLNILPLTGVTLPFLSMGGMALLVNTMEVGVVLSLVKSVSLTQDRGKTW